MILSSSCQKNKKEEDVEQIEQKDQKAKQTASRYSELTLYDDFDNELILDTISIGREAQFSPLYIGELSDSIKLTYKTAKINSRTYDWDEFKLPAQADLEIYIDTTRTVGFPMDTWEYYLETEHRVNKKSYPIFIQNQTLDTLSIGFGDILPMVTEMKNHNGNWTEIEKRFTYYCGTGRTIFFLPPNQIAITSIRQNFGNDLVLFRVKYELGDDDNILSNEIKGKIGIE